jgi:hypothetical protein
MRTEDDKVLRQLDEEFNTEESTFPLGDVNLLVLISN